MSAETAAYFTFTDSDRRMTARRHLLPLVLPDRDDRDAVPVSAGGGMPE